MRIDLSDFNEKRPCHHKGASIFENTVLDEEAQEQEGYESGLKLGRKGQFYQAGGPYDPTEYHRERRAWETDKCKHWKQYAQFCRKNRLAWLRGWKRGQQAARIEVGAIQQDPLWRELCQS